MGSFLVNKKILLIFIVAMFVILFSGFTLLTAQKNKVGQTSETSLPVENRTELISEQIETTEEYISETILMKAEGEDVRSRVDEIDDSLNTIFADLSTLEEGSESRTALETKAWDLMEVYQANFVTTDNFVVDYSEE